MSTAKPPEPELRLVADLGGTHLRLALVDAAAGPVQLQAVEVLKSAEIDSVVDCLASYWCRQGAPTLSALALCVAGPVEGEGRSARAQLTNLDLRVEAESVAYRFGVSRVSLINDFAAIAHAAPLLHGFDLQLHGTEAPRQQHKTVVIGPGTGLGVAAWLPGGTVVAGEGGHARLAPPDRSSVAVWNRLTDAHGDVFAEQVLSGPGLLALYRAVAALRGLPAEAEDPAAVWQQCTAGHAAAREAVWHFTAALGAYAGDLALIFGAEGVLLAGGILPRWGADFDVALFRTAFETREPRFQAHLHGVPSATVVHPYPALLGLGSSSV